MNFAHSFLTCDHKAPSGSSAFWTTTDGINIRILHCRKCGLKIMLDKRVVNREESVEDLPSLENRKILELAKQVADLLEENRQLRSQLAHIRSVLK